MALETEILSLCKSLKLSTLSFIKQNENIILLGQCGVGKTHLVIALAYKAVQHRYKAKFTIIAEFLNKCHKSKKGTQIRCFFKINHKPIRTCN